METVSAEGGERVVNMKGGMLKHFRAGYWLECRYEVAIYAYWDGLGDLESVFWASWHPEAQVTLLSIGLV
jgi:hypothetical protein